MARYNGFDYEADEKVSRTRVEWRDWIAEQRTRRSATVHLVDGETFVRVRAMGEPRPVLIAEIYATPSQLGVKPS